MNIANVMDQLATRLEMISGLRVFNHVPTTITPPAAIVSFPETYTYDTTMGRGVDSLTIPVFVLIGMVSDRSAKTRLAAYMDGSGTSSFKAVLRGGTYTAFSTHRIRDVSVDVYSMNGVEYLGAMFNVDITGPGD